jgi:hypothetical protein
MRPNITVIVVVFVGILILGSALFLFPPAIAAARPTVDNDGNAADDLAGAGMEFFGVTDDGEEFQVPQASLFAGSVWVGGQAVDNVYARVKTSYEVAGFKVETDHPLTVTAIVRIGDWYAEDPDNIYYATQSGSIIDPYYDPEDPAEVFSTSWEVTTVEEAQTDFILGKVYLAPQAGEASLFTTGTINDAMLTLFNWIHEGDSVVGKTLSVLFEARIKIVGSYEAIDGWHTSTVWSDWSMRYNLKVGLSGSAGVSGTVSVSIGSFSVSGGTQDFTLPILLMIVGGGGLFITLVAMPFVNKMNWG